MNKKIFNKNNSIIVQDKLQFVNSFLDLVLMAVKLQLIVGYVFCDDSFWVCFVLVLGQ
jgi:hypothetical protein